MKNTLLTLIAVLSLLICGTSCNTNQTSSNTEMEIKNNDTKYVFLAVAMKREREPLLQKMTDVKTLSINGLDICTGKLGNQDVIAGVSGPGLINMASMVSLVCSQFNISQIVNFGMVGGYGTEIHKNDLIICTEAMNIGSYMTDFKDEGIDIYKWNHITFTDGGEDKLKVYNSGAQQVEKAKGISYPNKMHYGRIGSADIWNNEKEMIKMLMNRYSIICEDMEAVAIYQVAEKFGVPCVAIKGVSDNSFLGEPYDDSVIPFLNAYVEEYIKKN